MTQSRLNTILVFFSLLVLAACHQSPDLEIKTTKIYPGVEEALWPFFAAFEQAAADRGQHIDLAAEGITGSIEAIPNHGTVGLCNHRPEAPDHVIIDESFWQMSNRHAKELIVFHELGHCYLGRGHNDQQRTDGTCMSIMRSGRGGCLDFYTNANRTDYLDELYSVSEQN